MLVATRAVLAGFLRTLLHRAVCTTAVATMNGRTILVRGANIGRADEIWQTARKQDDNNRGNEMAKSQQHTSHVRLGHFTGQDL